MAPTADGSPRADRWLRAAAWALTAVALLVLPSLRMWALSGGVSSRPGIVDPSKLGEPVVVMVSGGLALAGVALVHVRPRNLIGWLLLSCGVLQAVATSADAYSARALTDPDGSLPLGLAAAWLASWTWMPALLLPLAVLPPLYPTGRPASPFWRWHVRVALAGIALLVLVAATVQGGVDDTVSGTRLPWTFPGWWETGILVLTAAVVVPTLVVSLVGTLVRTLRASSPERQQLLWLVCVVAVMLVALFQPYRPVFVAAYAAVPLAVVVGVLRYQLLGIEVVLRRTLLYAPLTVLVALTVGLLTTTLARLVPDGPLPLLIASAVVAVVILPLAARLRGAVDRVVLGERADPLAVVDRLGAGLEEPSTDPVAAMLQVVARSVGASYAAVVDHDGRTLAELGSPAGEHREVELRHGGEHLGRLVVAGHRGQRWVAAADARLLDALAPHLAVVVWSQRLTSLLAAERERVVTATLSERARLRRDLHDGLGPSLSGISLGLEAATASLGPGRDTARDILVRTRQEADSAVREVRRVLDGLRPAGLDRLGLVDALRETAAGLGLGMPGRPAFRLDAEPLPPLPPEVEEAAYRIATESLANAARHSAAGACCLSLRHEDGHLLVEVSDDGRGGCVPRQGGVGLDSMRQRATALGGRLTVAPLLPAGTSVTAVLPLVTS